MNLNHKKIFTLFSATLFITGSMMSVAHAEDDDDHYRKPASNATWQAECGSCHVAFPARLLPAESWRAVMNGLDKHFGSDASMDDQSTKEISAFLEKNAGRRHESSGKPLLRITETRWFKREHDEVSSNTWKNPKVKSASNCAACHTGAEKGNYSEHDIRIPR